MISSPFFVRPILFAGVVVLSFVLTVPAFAVDDDSDTSSVDLTTVRAKIATADYGGALAELRGLVEDNQTADVYNLLGFTLRKTGDYATSLSYYRKALDLRPDFKPAHEYLGELYIETGQIDAAKGELAELARLCPAGCEERSDLEKALSTKVAD
jgi:tetratricopeptide (TPR) repeat protein